MCAHLVLEHVVLFEFIVRIFELLVRVVIYILLKDLETPHESWPHVGPTCCLGGPMRYVGGTHTLFTWDPHLIQVEATWDPHPIYVGST
jgi:hypothetical protein